MRFLAPMVILGLLFFFLPISCSFQQLQAKELQGISQDIIKSDNDSNMLIKALQNLSTMTWNFEKVGHLGLCALFSLT